MKGKVCVGGKKLVYQWRSKGGSWGVSLGEVVGRRSCRALRDSTRNIA